MSHLIKSQYDYRRESAAQRNIDNEKTAVENGMTKEQAELISKLCSMRHDFHCNMDKIAKGGEDYTSSWSRLDEDFASASLPPVGMYDQLCEIDDINGLMYDYGDDVPEDHDSKEFQEWYNENYERIYEELENANKSIENYLSEIDKKYHTSFAPTGTLRNF